MEYWPHKGTGVFPGGISDWDGIKKGVTGNGFNFINSEFHGFRTKDPSSLCQAYRKGLLRQASLSNPPRNLRLGVSSFHSGRHLGQNFFNIGISVAVVIAMGIGAGFKRSIAGSVVI